MSINTLTVIVTSASSFILSSVIFLILGWFCCIIYSRRKKKQLAIEIVTENVHMAGGSTPMIYENWPPVPNTSNKNELKSYACSINFI